ncbi:hypothetical protein TWF694_005758 [Orbilia ellipsospora]|uniref:BTB domain-containing protein n=1 Tax=Orbilia ellipsospora TaxID=2528407 RepID=A0AAV9WS21_9PEZI
MSDAVKEFAALKKAYPQMPNISFIQDQVSKLNIYTSSMEDDVKFSDLEVHVGSGQDFKIYKMHRVIVALQSEYFAGQVSQTRWTPGSHIDRVFLEDVEPKDFDRIYAWFYQGQDIFKPTDGLEPLYIVYDLASFLGIPILKKHVIRLISSPEYQQTFTTGTTIDLRRIVGFFNLVYAHSTESERATDLKKMLQNLLQALTVDVVMAICKQSAWMDKMFEAALLEELKVTGLVCKA